MAMTDGILKFLDKSPSANPHRGKKCFPCKSSGVSRESPKEFHLKNSLIDKDGYLWNQPQDNRFFHSKYITVVGSKDSPTDFSQDFEEAVSKARFCFNRRKGLLADFLDNHAWKRKVEKLMGFERSDVSRTLRNSELNRLKSEIRSKRLSLTSVSKEEQLSHSKSLIKNNPQHNYQLFRQSKLSPIIRQFQSHIQKPPQESISLECRAEARKHSSFHDPRLTANTSTRPKSSLEEAASFFRRQSNCRKLNKRLKDVSM